MEQKKYFFAVDLGATSGRTIIGNIENGKFDLEEVTRFPITSLNRADTSIGTSTPSTSRLYVD